MATKNKKNLISILIGYILDILLGVVSVMIIIGIYYIVQIKVFQSDYSNLFGYTFFEIATGSMSNTIEIGDVVIVQITKNVNKNDIIVYKDEDNFITHRLVEKDGSKLIAKGDANNSEDKPIKEEQILGKVIYIIPKLGIWRKIFLSPEIIGLILTLLFLLGIVFQFSNRKDNSKDTEDNKNE